MATGSFTPEILDVFRRNRERRNLAASSQTNRPRTLSQASLSEGRAIEQGANAPEGSISQPVSGPSVTRTDVSVSSNLLREGPAQRRRAPTLLSGAGFI